MGKLRSYSTHQKYEKSILELIDIMPGLRDHLSYKAMRDHPSYKAMRDHPSYKTTRDHSSYKATFSLHKVWFLRGGLL
jgi:hypothetical protein